MKTYHTFSSQETEDLGARLAGDLLSRGPVSDRRHKARVVALHGELGAGKTTFIKGFLKGLGVRRRVTSPTFVLMKKFPLGPTAAKKAGLQNAYHIDAYRFRAPRESDALGLKGILKDPMAVVLVEWPEKLKGLLPAGRTVLKFRHGGRENERVIIAP